jgi:hypothetical protein
MHSTAIKQLKTHPAQMRTTYNLESLATLTLQVFERGLDTWQPVVATPNGDGFHIVSGHRRQMAQLLAFALQEWAREHTDTEISIEVVQTMLNTLVTSLGSLDKVIASLLEKYGEKAISYVLFEGSQKEQILALQAANSGGEDPDMLGIAHSFRQAANAGATPEEIARNNGRHLHFVQNHLALTKIPADLAQRIAAGELPLSVASAVADLPEPKRTGLAIFILANEPGKLTAKAIKACAVTLKKWNGLTLPLMVKHQSQRNIARALARLWSQVLEAYPDDAYAAAAMLIYRNVHEEPWATQEKLTLWFQALGGDIYFVDGRIHWGQVVAYLLNEVDCTTCPIAQLPRQKLHVDLSQGHGGPLGMPCRVGETAERCLHGLAPNDAFDLRVPWEWSQHPGVVNEGGDYRVKSYEDLLTAWKTQAEKEKQEAEITVAAAVETPAAVDADSQVIPAESSSAASASPIHGTAPTSLESNVIEVSNSSPIVKQRTLIADYMKRHEQFAVGHPLATPCSACRHQLDSSPTKDDSVPHCAWASRLRNVTFKILEADGQKTKGNISQTVPVCRQFAPNQPWSGRIPAHPEPPGIPREWLKAQLLHLVKAANQHGSGRNAFEFLTGRPMGANENYSDWFEKQLETQGGELSDAQLFTLFVWAHAEWQRAKSRTFSLPLNGRGIQFALYREQPWRTEDAI